MRFNRVQLTRFYNKDLKCIFALILNLHKNEVVFAVLLQMRREKNDAIVFLLTMTNIKMKFIDSIPIMAWLVGWAAELLSKYSCGDDGKSPHERLHGETCITPFVPFGESVFYFQF